MPDCESPEQEFDEIMSSSREAQTPSAWNCTNVTIMTSTDGGFLWTTINITRCVLVHVATTETGCRVPVSHTTTHV